MYLKILTGPKTGVEILYYKPPGFSNLSDAEKEELLECRSVREIVLLRLLTLAFASPLTSMAFRYLPILSIRRGLTGRMGKLLERRYQ